MTCGNAGVYWATPTKTQQHSIPSHSRTNTSPPKPTPPYSARGGTDFCHAASPSCFDRRSRNLRWGGAFMRVMPRWAPGCCNTSRPPLPRVDEDQHQGFKNHNMDHPVAKIPRPGAGLRGQRGPAEVKAWSRAHRH